MNDRLKRVCILVLVLLAAFDAPEDLGNPMNPLIWTIGPVINGRNYSRGMLLHPAANPGGGWYFDWPQADGVHYVTRAPIEAGRRSVRMTFEIQGEATFREVGGDGPGLMRLYIQRRGDNWSGAGAMASYRFWSPPFELKPGKHEMTHAFAPEQWTNVFGQADAAGLQVALADLENFGFTFGGRFAGHGAYAIGPARFVLTEYALW
jgi:hypothetical protein